MDQADLAMSDSKDIGRESRDFFDRWAPRYDRSAQQRFFFGPAHVAALKAASAADVAPKDILDVGCGTGRLLERAAQQWPQAHLGGIDASPQMIAEANRKHGGNARFHFEVADAVLLPFGESSVDVAFSTFSHHHWSDQQGGVGEISRVLRPGGVFILANIELCREADSRQQLFGNAGLKVIEQRRPLRLAGPVLLTVGRKS
jgi:ubiquinone/menaquinone biosynthesis C-methylase UbiE